MKLDIKIDTRELDKLFDTKLKQVPFAMAKTLTLTAKDVQAALVHEMRDSFDRPTPFTLNSVFVTAATKKSQQAIVGLKDYSAKGSAASKYLAPEIEGGPRGNKRFEKALQAAGVLPPGYFVVPGATATLDAYGNIARSLIVQLLSYFKAFPQMGYKANITDKRKALMAKDNKRTGKLGVVYFVGRPGGGRRPLGVWARYTFGHGSAVKPVLIFVRGVNYEKRLDYFYAAQKAIEKSLPRRIKETFDALTAIP
jgi:hypothetical protein